MGKKLNIFITSVGRRSYMVNYFKEALDGNGLVHAGNSKATYSMKLADRSVITPLIYDQGYIGFLLGYCLKHHISAIISMFDIDLPVLSINRKLFAEYGITVIVSDYDVTQICNDKWLTNKFLVDNGFATVPTFISPGKAIDAIKDGRLHFPVIIKPRWGMASIGMFIAENDIELEVLYNKSFKKINETYLKYESAATPNEKVIIQEMIDGQEYSLDVFNDLNGFFLQCTVKEKLDIRAGESMYCRVVRDDALENIGLRLSKRLKHIAVLDLDCIKKGKEYYIIDMNARFGGTYAYTHLAGANFPKAIIKMLLNEKIDTALLTTSAGITGIKDIVPVQLKNKGHEF